jgi:peptidoglycan hydrolase-like protein with peptidoglycan-binding domain
MRYMFDSDNETYPSDVQIIAAYVDGSRTGHNFARAHAAHPGAQFWLISAVGDVDGDVIDIEPGNVWPPSNAVDWIKRQRARGADPAFYCNTSTLNQCLQAFADAGIETPHWWRADYNGVQDLEMGEIAHQYADPLLTGSHWDASVIDDDMPGLSAGSGTPARGTTSTSNRGGSYVSPNATSVPGVEPFDGVNFNLDPGHYYGLVTGPATSHGGFYAVERPPIVKIQQRLQQLGFAPAASGWADGIFGQPTVDAVAAWQRARMPATRFFGQIWGDDWDVLFAPAPDQGVPANSRGGLTNAVGSVFAPARTAPPWPSGFGPNDHLGDIAGPADSHGGDPLSNGSDVTASIIWVQQRLQELRWASSGEPSWVDGVFGRPTIDAVTAWQRDRLPGTKFFGQVWPDDYAALQDGGNRINV